MRPPPPPRPPREAFAGSAWFHMKIGRRENADPKWLLPLICRRGNVTRQEIGAIRIFERETKFEVSAVAADKFVHALRKSGTEDIEITPLAGSSAEAPNREAPRRDAPARPPHKYAGPPKHAEKPRRPDRPREDRKDKGKPKRKKPRV